MANILQLESSFVRLSTLPSTRLTTHPKQRQFVCKVTRQDMCTCAHSNVCLCGGGLVEIENQLYKESNPLSCRSHSEGSSVGGE